MKPTRRARCRNIPRSSVRSRQCRLVRRTQGERTALTSVGTIRLLPRSNVAIAGSTAAAVVARYRRVTGLVLEAAHELTLGQIWLFIPGTQAWIAASALK